MATGTHMRARECSSGVRDGAGPSLLGRVLLGRVVLGRVLLGSVLLGSVLLAGCAGPAPTPRTPVPATVAVVTVTGSIPTSAPSTDPQSTAATSTAATTTDRTSTAAATTGSQAPAGTDGAGATDPVTEVLDAVAGRLAVADDVALAKWDNDRQAITDPTQEAAVLAAVAQQAAAQDVDADLVQRVFRAQIDASKQVQQALYDRWTADPASVPSAVPDLTGARARIATSTAELITALQQARSELTGPACPATVDAAVARLAAATPDPVQAAALPTATAPLCGAG